MTTIIKKLIIWSLFVLSVPFLISCNQSGNDQDPPPDDNTPPVYDFTARFQQEVVERQDGIKKEWNKVSSYIYHYGKYNAEMKDYDVAIINGGLLADPDIAALTDAGTYVIAAVSFGEDAYLTYNQTGEYSDYYILAENGRPAVSDKWHSYYVDARTPIWQNKIITQVDALAERGVDGILVDKLAVTSLYPETKQGMTALVRLIKKRHPDLKLILKDELGLLPALSSLLSGVLLEQFCSDYDLANGRALMKDEAALAASYQQAIATVNEVRKYHYFPVFTLDYVNEFEYLSRSQIYYDLCWELDFISYCTYDYFMATPGMPKVSRTAERGILALADDYVIPEYEDSPFDFLPLFQKEVTAREDNKKKQWSYVSDFICYYGAYDERLAAFDVAIIDARWWSKEEVQALAAAGTYVISYVSVGEDDSLNFDEKGNYCDYYIFDDNGEPTKNGNWNSYFVDAGKESWQMSVLDKVWVLCEKGVDGIFMDTIDTAVAFKDTKDGMISLIRRMKAEFPQLKFVANRGFELLPQLSSSISGLMYEDFCSGYDFAKDEATVKNERQLEKSYQRAVNIVNAVRKYNYFPVFALDYVNEYEYDSRSQQYYDICWQYDFIPYCTYRIALDTVCNPNVEITTDRGINALG